MSDVRRVRILEGGDRFLYNFVYAQDDENGTHALLPWEEYELLRKVVVIAEREIAHRGWCECEFCMALRELEESND